MRIKKILLISSNIDKTPYPVYPIGLSYISSFLESEFPDFNIKIFDFNIGNIDTFISLIKKFNPDYFGLSIRNVDDANSYISKSYNIWNKKVVEIIRQHSKNKIIIGGSGYSIFPVRLFSYLKPDFGIYGEGEASFFPLNASDQNI